MVDRITQIKHITPFMNLLDKAIEEEFLIGIEELQGKAKSQPLPQYRAIYINMARKIAPYLTYRELGLLLNRDHCTAIWYVKNFEDWVKYDKSFNEFYTRVEEKFEQLKKEYKDGLVKNFRCKTH